MRRLNARGSSGRLLRLGGFCQRRAASRPSSVSVPVAGRLPPGPRLCQSLSAAGCLSALGPPGPRPPTAARRAPPSTSEGAYGSETAPPPPDSAPLRPLSLLMPGSGHTRRCIPPASVLRDRFRSFQSRRWLFPAVRANYRHFLSRGWLFPATRDRFHRFRARKSLFPVVRANFRSFQSRGRTFPAVGDSFRLFQSPSASGSGTFRWKRR